MTLIDAAVLAKLRAASTITALVGSRVYPDALPPSPALPALTVRKISDIPDPEVGAAHRARVQVSCWSNPTPANGVRSPAEVEGLASAVGALLHSARLNSSPTSWTAGATTYRVLSTRATFGPRLTEDGSGYYHVPVDVLVDFTE
jgi:hypothetical protein